MSVVALPMAYIRAYLASLSIPGAKYVAREGPTLYIIAKHTGIPKNTLVWLANKDTAGVSHHRQMLLSKVIAQIENGELTFEVRGMRKVAVMNVKPKPVVRYQPTFGPRGASLRTLDRPKPYRYMPSFKDAVLK